MEINRDTKVLVRTNSGDDGSYVNVEFPIEANILGDKIEVEYKVRTPGGLITRKQVFPTDRIVPGQLHSIGLTRLERKRNMAENLQYEEYNKQVNSLGSQIGGFAVALVEADLLAKQRAVQLFQQWAKMPNLEIDANMDLAMTKGNHQNDVFYPIILRCGVVSIYAQRGGNQF